jgi:hypothetical protein
VTASLSLAMNKSPTIASSAIATSPQGDFWQSENRMILNASLFHMDPSFVSTAPRVSLLASNTAAGSMSDSEGNNTLLPQLC